MVYAHHCPLPEQPSQQQHQQPPPCTDGDAGAVDLRLAESYTPLCLCLIKCTLVVACHSLLAPAQAHVLCISALALDRVCAHACERVVDTNAVAWGLLATFLMVSGATTPGASAPLHGAHHHLPHHVAALFGLWMVLSSVHLLHGGVPGLHGTPSTAFLSGLREPCSAPLPRHEVIACILTAMAMLVVCDPGIRTVVFLRDMDGLSGGLSGNSSWDVVWCIGARGAAYATLSCTWSYTIVVLSASRHGAASSGHSIARSTAVLTTTRSVVPALLLLLLPPSSSSPSFTCLFLCTCTHLPPPPPPGS